MSECEVTKVNLPKFPTPQLIVLTVEEAKRIAKKLNDIGLQHEVDFGDFDYDALDLAESLSERIEQVEKCNRE